MGNAARTVRATSLRIERRVDSLRVGLPTAAHVMERRLAERVGFEPTVEFPLHTLSKRAPSTTRTSLRICRINGLRASGSAQNPNCDRNCDTPPTGLRSLRGTPSDAPANPTSITARPSTHDAEKALRPDVPDRVRQDVCVMEFVPGACDRRSSSMSFE